MADRYLDSGSASESTPYESTSTAAHDLNDFDVGVIATNLAVDQVIWVSNTHSETFASPLFFTSSPNATPESPQRILCVTDLGTNSALVSSPAASISCSHGSGMNFEGYLWAHGVSFTTTSSSLTFGVTTSGPHVQFYHTCKFTMSQVNNFIEFRTGNAAGSTNDQSVFHFHDCEFKFAAGGQCIQIRHADAHYKNISIDAAGTTPTSLFEGYFGTYGRVFLEDSDLSNVSLTNLLSDQTSGFLEFRARNIKLPSGITYCTQSATSNGVEMYLDDITVGTAHVPYYRNFYTGEVFCEQTILPNATADRMYLRNDDTEPHAMKLDAHATHCSRWNPLYSDWLHIEVEDTATAITPFAEILVEGDGASALKDIDTWIEVDAKTVASTSNEAARSTDGAAATSSGTDQAAGTISWTGHGYTTPRTHKLALGSSITPVREGYIRIRVALGKANSAIFIGKVGYS